MPCAIGNFTRTIAEQSGNSALIEALARFALQIQLCGTITSVSREFAERAAHGCDDIIQAFKARDTPRAAFLVRDHISHTQEAISRALPMRQRLAKAGITSSLSESCYRMTFDKSRQRELCGAMSKETRRLPRQA